MSAFTRVWLCMIAVRLLWALWPQTSYIHPDEFFQTVEVVAGKSFDIQVERTWEFNKENPLRSMVLPSLLFGPGFQLLNYFSKELEWFSMTGKLMLQSCRLVMLLLSFWLDLCVYMICKAAGVQSNVARMLLASSYVMLTFQIHSFSNSLETVLVTTEILLIVMVVKQYTVGDFQNDLKVALKDKVVKMLASKDRQTENLEMADQLSQLHKSVFSLRKRTISGSNSPEQPRKPSVVDRLEFSADAESLVLKCMQSNTKSPLSLSMPALMIFLSLVNTIGVFNRPTFALFAMGPFLWWFDVSQFSAEFFKHISVFIASSLLSVVGFVLLDTSFYLDKPVYAILSDIDFVSLKNFTQTFKITPYNFIVYNSSPLNLETHGLHSPCVHLLVNMPLLFGPMLIPIGYMIYKEVRQWFKKWRRTDSDSSTAEKETDSEVARSEEGSDNENERMAENEDKGVNEISADECIEDKTEGIDNVNSDDTNSDEENSEENCDTVDSVKNGELSKQKKDEKTYVSTLDVGDDENDADKDLDLVEVLKDEQVCDKRGLCRVIDKGLKLIEMKVEQKLQQDLRTDLLLFIMFPVLALSAFLHQEARFLIPLLSLVTLVLNLEYPNGLKKLFWSSLIVFNIMLSLVFGFLHQGGVVPCLFHLQKISQDHLLRNPGKELSIIFSHTYMPAKHLLLLPNDSLVNVTDFKGQDLDSVCEYLKQEIHMANNNATNTESHVTHKKAIYFALTGTLAKDFRDMCRNSVHLKIVAKFFPHLSFEELPNLDEMNTNNWKSLLSLYLFRVT